ncbi:MAG: NUDIX domain-containing protein [Bacteroidetes Order II. Incertae sedis bacterium]|nr:NUDIX domain-containing protein [Bacteroidetes Order II. bacterium]
MYHFCIGVIRLLLHLRNILTRLIKPRSVRVRGIVTNTKGEVLLIKHPYDDRYWYLPGGGIKRQERLADALHRELQEELGFQHLVIIQTLGVYTDLNPYRSDVVVVIVAATDENPQPNKWEIKEACFFSLKALPDNMARSTRERLTEWQNVSNVYNERW